MCCKFLTKYPSLWFGIALASERMGLSTDQNPLQEPAKGRTGTMQELMDTKRQLRAQQAANKKLQEQFVIYEKEVEALRSNFSASQSQASVAKVSTEINSKVQVTANDVAGHTSQMQGRQKADL